MKNNNRLLLILKYLLDQTDEDHCATIADINEYLSKFDLDGNRKTISNCVDELIEVGYDIICVRSTQNQYYMRGRPFDLAEIKMLVDAVQSSRFIPEDKSFELVSKLSGLVGTYKGDILKRQLYIESRAKTDNANVVEYVDKLHEAINQNKKIKFKYFDYNSDKEKVLRYDGYTYTLSPKVMLWNNDMYYVVGVYKDKEGLSKFRVDRMCNIAITEEESADLPEGFDMAEFFEREFSMMNGELNQVELLCENKLMSSIIDKFGLDVKIEKIDEKYFKAIVDVNLSRTFYGWVFASGGAMRIVAPEHAKEEFKEIIKTYL